MAQLAGPDANQLPAAGHLGRLAFQDPAAVVIEPQASATPTQPGEMVFQLTSNTQLTVKVLCPDNVLRAVNFTLA